MWFLRLIFHNLRLSLQNILFNDASTFPSRLLTSSVNFAGHMWHALYYTCSRPVSESIYHLFCPCSSPCFQQVNQPLYFNIKSTTSPLTQVCFQPPDIKEHGQDQGQTFWSNPQPLHLLRYAFNPLTSKNMDKIRDKRFDQTRNLSTYSGMLSTPWHQRTWTRSGTNVLIKPATSPLTQVCFQPPDIKEHGQDQGQTFWSNVWIPLHNLTNISIEQPTDGTMLATSYWAFVPPLR